MPFATFERERIASRISEVKQMRKEQGYFVGGRRAFGFDIVDGIKVPNPAEQALIVEMKTKREAGSSLLAIHRWLNEIQGVKLAYSFMRLAIRD
jgi:DNA invertase Pin-like site-specific DNA recombinase